MRAQASELFAHLRDRSVLVQAQGVTSIASEFIDEACQRLIAGAADRVTFVGASKQLREDFMRAHMLRRAKFSVEFR
jgi:hypothetical protein